MSGPSEKAVFLDRDGTLNVEKEYLSDPEALVLFPHLGPALRSLMKAGYQLFIVTNQSGIGRGYYSQDDMRRVNERLCAVLEKQDVRFAEIYFAPEAPDQPSRGRKPSPQFLLDARDAFNIDLSQSFMVGDKISDLGCGWNAGVRHSILVQTGYGEATERKLTPEQREKTIVVADCVEAARWILNQEKKGES